MILVAPLEIVQNDVQRVGEEVPAPVAVPVDEAGDALGKKLQEGEGRERPEMDVRYMGKSEHILP
jgi:hypothetical protein